MKKTRQYKECSYLELKELFENTKGLKDLNVLGFYRSLLENKNLSSEQKVELRNTAHLHFEKQFNFLQRKDPSTYLKVTLIGKEFTKGDEENLWRQIVINQQAILKEKGIKHRNFGVYSIHKCGYDWCPYNGMMVRQGSALAESKMHFKSDKPKNSRKQKSRFNKGLSANITIHSKIWIKYSPTRAFAKASLKC